VDILENAPPALTGAQLRVFLTALINLAPYTLTDDVAEHFACDDENNQKTAEEILASALSDTPDEKLTPRSSKTSSSHRRRLSPNQAKHRAVKDCAMGQTFY
jgi:hypothetical protein